MGPKLHYKFMIDFMYVYLIRIKFKKSITNIKKCSIKKGGACNNKLHRIFDFEFRDRI